MQKVHAVCGTGAVSNFYASHSTASTQWNFPQPHRAERH